jgi:DNA polymerase
MVRGHQIVPDHGRRVTDVLKGMLRPSLMASKGKRLVVADWAAIEARVTPWASNSTFGGHTLDIFAKGEDLYCHNAAATFHVPYTEIVAGHEAKDKKYSDMRQIGKVQELACGFAGGVGAFASMGRIYGLVMSESAAKRMVDAWRRANKWAVPYWSGLEETYMRAMRNKNREFSVGRITYLFDGLHLWYALPSGRVLCYPFARFNEEGDLTYAKASWKPAADAKEWPRARLWRGLACENITQAVANDLLRYALRQLDDVVLHIHDEIVLEVPEADAEAAAARLVQVMCEPPPWASGLPLNAEVAIMERYGK